MTTVTAPSGRYLPHVKLAIVDAIRSGEISRDEAIAQHGLSEEELDGWMDRATRFGLDGMRVHQLQVLR